MREAKERGHKVDEPVLAELTKWVAESGDGKTGVPRPAGIPNAEREACGCARVGRRPEADPVAHKGLKLLVQTIKDDQTENGSWSSWPKPGRRSSATRMRA